MKRVITSLEAEPVGIAHLRRSCPAYVRVIEYDRLPKKGSIGQLFGTKYKAVILLYEFHDSKHRTEAGKGHYVCICKRQKGVEYFSSYGLPPAAEINATHSDPDRLMSLLGRKYTLNRTRFQGKYHTATCGRWAFARALLADLPLAKFQAYFGKKLTLNKPDDIVALATIFSIR